MAYDNELFASGTLPKKFRIYPEFVAAKDFIADAAAAKGGTAITEYPTGMPVGQVTATGKWSFWSEAATAGVGTDTILGFLAEPLKFSTSGETTGAVMLTGRIHYDDIVSIGLIDGQETTETDDLVAAIKTTMRTLGIHIDGLPGVS